MKGSLRVGLILGLQITGLAAGAAVVLAVFTETDIVLGVAEPAIPVAGAPAFNLVADSADKILGHNGEDYPHSAGEATAQKGHERASWAAIAAANFCLRSRPRNLKIVALKASMSALRKLAAVLIFGSAGGFLIDRFHPVFEAMLVAGVILAVWDGVRTYRRPKSPVQTLFANSSAGNPSSRN